MKLNKRSEAILQVEVETRDRNIGLKQGFTIERLTYLTIVYLPISLIASIYAIPGEHKVLSDGMGLGWFLWSILIASVATYLLAIYIKAILKFFKATLRFFLHLANIIYSGLRRLLYYSRLLVTKEPIYEKYKEKRNLRYPKKVPGEQVADSAEEDHGRDANNTQNSRLTNEQKSAEEGSATGFSSRTNLSNDPASKQREVKQMPLHG
ncbi:hypothetical protein V8E51_013829 [Hyaloscypha variabilis]